MRWNARDGGRGGKLWTAVPWTGYSHELTAAGNPCTGVACDQVSQTTTGRMVDLHIPPFTEKLMAAYSC